MTTPPLRTAARVIALDDDQRVLLLRYELALDAESAAFRWRDSTLMRGLHNLPVRLG